MLTTSLPINKVSEEAIKKDHRFRLNKRIYWSNRETTNAWIAEIFLTHQETMIRIHNLTSDCKTIHQSKKFREWIQATYAFIILLFVPANCTKIFQPCDFRLQRLFKHGVKQSASEFFLNHMKKNTWKE